MVKVLNKKITKDYAIYNGDCCEVIQGLKDNSIDYTVFSPPFASLFTYSNSERDMGNSKSKEQFLEHYKFLANHLFRVTKVGRLVSVHCMTLPTFKQKDGVIGIYDFRGDLIRVMQEVGFVYHSEVCIWKDPVLAAVRTKALGLLHKQLKKDSSKCRQGLPDYICTFRKDGECENPIKHDDKNFPVELWQRYASPVWMDIKQTNTLNYMMSKESEDEKHLCPLQQDVIERCVMLWSNPGDVVFSPFAGIGSEGYKALRMGRKSIAIELKESYYNFCVQHHDIALKENREQGVNHYPNPYKDKFGDTVKPDHKKQLSFEKTKLESMF